MCRARGCLQADVAYPRVVPWTVRELSVEETYALRRSVSADGRKDLVTVHDRLDDSAGAWHMGAVDEAGRVVAISSLYAVPSPLRPELTPAFQLHNMAVEPALHRRGIGGAVMDEILRRLRATGTALLWASARDSALPFYAGFGFRVVEAGGFVAQTGRPHHIIELDLRLTYLNSPRAARQPRYGRSCRSRGPRRGRSSGAAETE